MGVSCIVDSITGKIAHVGEQNVMNHMGVRINPTAQFQLATNVHRFKMLNALDVVRIQHYQHLEAADICSQLELCRWIKSNPHMIRNILLHDEAHLPVMESTIQETPIYGIVIIHMEMLNANTNIASL
jgi:hypothetical protein